MSNVPNIKVEKSRRRSLTLTVTRDRQVLVKAPLFTPQFIIDQFVEKNQEWIEKRLAKLQTGPIKGSKKYIDGEVFRFLGKDYTMQLGTYTKITLKDETLFFPKALVFRAEKEMHAWYKKQAELFITRQVEKFADEIGTTYSELAFSDTKSQWGSCSQDNRLQFSWRLIMAPILVVNYVIIHELAHTIEKNHSRDFWKIVEKHTPSFRQSRKWLKDNGHGLVY